MVKDKKNDTALVGMPDMGRLFQPIAEGTMVEVAVMPSDYSASVIARAVEDIDAHLLNLNVMAARSEHDELLVHLRVDRRSPGALARSLERYGLRVVGVETTEANDTADDNHGDDTARERVNELLRLLEV